MNSRPAWSAWWPWRGGRRRDSARFALRKSLTVIPVGIAMGVMVMCMTMVNSVKVAYPLLILVGLLGGFFLVPMNALLQHRGHVLMSAGHSIAVQNFNENLSILTMLAVYSLMLRAQMDVIILLFGLFWPAPCCTSCASTRPTSASSTPSR
jgi:phosphatidylglycerophosphate synthase